MAANKFPAQVELIERVKATLNLSDEALAAEVSVRPETMQKYAAGYQKAGGKLMQIIKRLPEGSGRRSQARAETRGLPHDVCLEHLSTVEQLGFVLQEGAINEVRMLRQIVATLFQQVETRRLAAVGSRAEAVLFERRPQLLPALGYIPAGLPQVAVEQAGDQFLAVAAGKFPDAEYALRVHGDSMVDADIHHGDWVLMSARLAPRNGSVVAALCDNETCLKTYVADPREGVYLRSENKEYPPRIVPREEMQIQGVMVGKVRIGNW